ncbi:MAG: magnesium transporter CorA family protein [Butyricicoccus pullicaecorum]|uniref:Magnesium transporter n=1 Tax=Butyricicoccus pullicaecorum TaxID=501571 RepID=A0A1Y4L3R5_9FIRM|nr:magnesium transporter CorA family protein [Butyricicoccus pullicaecorum]MBS5280708.1 magnesium transporter CorA family protein [Butyricicoccus pullicaecorum]MDY2970500.1 magnesium transporter CorA family protein [Butyricicoccus pullicaecorum]OUP51428.1 magnesium transporter [Butyricicoccus pullicaecorum]
MIEYFKSDARLLSPLYEFEPGCWVNLVRPTSEEITHVLATTGVEEDFLRAALDPEESSRVELEEDQTLLIVDIPTLEESNVEQDESKIFGTLPMGIIVLPNTVITVCLQDTTVLRGIAQNKVRDIHTAMRTRFVLQILLRVAGLFLRNLRMIERDFTKIERRLYDSLKNEELIQLLGLSKSLVYFSASLKGNEVTMEKMLRGRILKLYEDDRDLLEDALIEIRQAIEMAGIYSSILAGTMDAYASVVSNNLNIIMKVLTVITIIMTIPNIIFGFYGMNITGNDLPFAYWWWVPVVISICGCIGAWIYMKRKDLL